MAIAVRTSPLEMAFPGCLTIVSMSLTAPWTEALKNGMCQFSFLPNYSDFDTLVTRLSEVKENLLARYAEKCRPIVRRLVQGVELKDAHTVAFNYTLGISEQGADPVYLQMVRTKGLEPLRLPTGT